MKAGKRALPRFFYQIDKFNATDNFRRLSLMAKKTVKDIDLKDKKVLVRVDFNVP